MAGKRAGGAAASGGAYEYLRPAYTLPTGMTFNALTGFVDGTVLDTTYSAPASEDVACLTDLGSRASNYAALSSAISSAAGGGAGKRIRLAAGADYGGQYTLPVNNSSGWIYIESAGIKTGSLPEGTRVVAADASLMPKLYATGVEQPVFLFTAGNAKYRFVGLDVTFAPSGVSWPAEGAGNGMFGFFLSTSESATDADYPSDIVIDRCYVHGTLGLNCKRGIFMNAKNVAVIDSRISEIVGSASTDGQCFAVTSGAGPYKIVNNYLDQASLGEHVAFGGGNARITPADIEVQRNHFTVPFAWYAAGRSLKNLYEMKVGFRSLIQSNVFENYFTKGVGSQYFAVTLKTVDQEGNVPATGVRDCTMRLNEFKNVSGWLQLAAQPEAYLGHGGTAMNRVELTSNRVLDPTNDYTTAAKVYAIQNDVLIDNLRMRHNTIRRYDNAGDEPVMFLPFAGTNGSLDQEFTDNLWVYTDTTLGLWWQNTDLLSSKGLVGYNAVTNNGVIGAYTGNAMTNPELPDLPTGNTSVASIAAADLAASTYALNPSSPLKGTATSGRDPGAVHALIDTAISGVA